MPHAQHQDDDDQPGDAGDLSDLLSELRILLPGAQMLTAFLIILPFNGGFAKIVQAEKIVFLLTFFLSMTSLVLLSAPAIQHRVMRPLQDRERFKRVADRIAVLVSDQRMPGAYGNELLSYAWDRHPHIVRILTTAYSELEHTVEAVNQGQIHRYIQKPWDIAALRMELKQALELARLRNEHAQLLREKLMVRQRQAVANRIGTLYALCASLAGPEQQLPVEAYLSAALTAGVTPPEPDWLLMDYADLVSSEAFRGTAFAAAVRQQLDTLEREHPGRGVEQVVDMLLPVFGAALQSQGGTALFLDGRLLTEFLETPTTTPVSAIHSFWLA
ncbi:MAG: DUF6328 family protein, partial [Janthinobacterium sp.]